MKKILVLLVNLVLMSAVLVLVVFLVFRGIDNYTRHGESISVPDVIGMSVPDAARVFEEHGLQCIVSDSTYVKDEVPGRILDYSPGRNKRVKEGRIIYLTINTQNIPEIPIPDVADNSSVRQARASMLAAGFKLTEDEYMRGQKDWVYAVKYKGKTLPTGGKAPKGASLTLVVGRPDEGELDFESDSLNFVDGYGYSLTDSIDPTKTSEPQVDETWFK